MYWINNSKTGSRMFVESYDRVIELFDTLYENRYQIYVDDEMSNVWWIDILKKSSDLPKIVKAFMVTNLQPASDLRIEK
jgi:hypothetical protein